MFEALIRRGTLMTVIAGIVGVIGLVAAFTIPIQMIPDLQVRTISIETSWPGATPQDIEQEILLEQEEYLRSIPSLQELNATASPGSAEIELEFPFDADMDQTLIQVTNALQQVPGYPVNVDQPRVRAESFSSNSFMYFRVTPLDGNPRDLDMDMMQDYVDDRVRTRMENVEGVSSVDLGGGAERQIHVLADAEALASRGLTVADLRAAMRARNRDVSAGEIEAGKRRYLLRTVGRLDDLDALEALVVRRSGATTIRLRDVAEVRLDHSEIRGERFVDGKPILNLSVNRQIGSNVLAIKDRMLAEVEAINAEFLNREGMELALNATDTVYVEQSIATVWRNLAIGAVLATLVMYAFLRSSRATLIGVMGVPLCTIAAFIGLLLTDRTINVISLAGVAFAIGMTLDNSIVVLESIEHERRKGLDRLRAAASGVRKVWPAVLASTLTTVLVFTPIVFITLEAGQLYSDIAVAVSASILVSMLVAITLVPPAAAWLGLGAGRRDAQALASAESVESGGPAEPQAASVPARGRVIRMVDWLLARRRRRLATLAITVVTSLGIFWGLTPAAEYLPPGEEPKIFAAMNAPPGTSLAHMRTIGYEIQDDLLPLLEAEPEAFDRGETDMPAMDYMIFSIDPDRLRIIAEPKRRALADVEALMDGLDARFEDYPGMRAFATRGSIITSNDGGTRSVNLDISGPDLARIYAAASAAYDRAEAVFDNPDIQANPASLTLSQPLIEVRPDWDRAAEAGVDTEAIGYTVAALTDGAYADEFYLANDKLDIYIHGRDGADVSPPAIPDLPIHTPQGGVVPLSSLAEVRETVDTNVIRRLDGRRTVTLNIIPPSDVPLETGVEIVRTEVLEHLRTAGAIPADVNIAISGASDQLEATRAALLGNYAVALVLVYLVMVAIFTHWGYPLLIMTAIPLGVAGGIAGLWLLNGIGGLLPLVGLNGFQQPFDMISMLGFLILMGTVVNNPILIVHRSASNVREAGMAAKDAVQEAVASRLRPIAMSALTTVFGLAPLVFIPGAGTELYRGVGAIVLFGLAGTAIVTLTFLPVLTTMVLGWGERRRASRTPAV